MLFLVPYVRAHTVFICISAVPRPRAQVRAERNNFFPSPFDRPDSKPAGKVLLYIRVQEDDRPDGYHGGGHPH